MVFGPSWAPLLHRPPPFGRALPCRASGVVRVHFSWFSPRSVCPLLRPLILRRGLLQPLLAVDEAVGRLIDALRESGELENTYVFFTSDNGWHAGEHRLTTGKWTAYEEDTRVPLIVRGPGVPEGRELEHLALNNDLAPTFADLSGVTPPDFVDARSSPC